MLANSRGDFQTIRFSLMSGDRRYSIKWGACFEADSFDGFKTLCLLFYHPDGEHFLFEIIIKIHTLCHVKHCYSDPVVLLSFLSAHWKKWEEEI